MEIVFAALVAAAVAAAVTLVVQRPRAAGIAPAPLAAPERREAGAPSAAPVRGEQAADDLPARRSEIARLEERLSAKEGLSSSRPSGSPNASVHWMTVSATWSATARSSRRPRYARCESSSACPG